MSRLEKRSDLLLSTLRSYIEAMGGQLSLIAEFPNREPVTLSGLATMETAPPSSHAPPPPHAPSGPRCPIITTAYPPFQPGDLPLCVLFFVTPSGEADRLSPAGCVDHASTLSFLRSSPASPAREGLPVYAGCGLHLPSSFYRYRWLSTFLERANVTYT